MRDLYTNELEVVSGGGAPVNAADPAGFFGMRILGTELNHQLGAFQVVSGAIGFGDDGGVYSFSVAYGGDDVSVEQIGSWGEGEPDDEGSFYGGGWYALVAGASVSGGGGDGHGSAGAGLGGLVFFGWSADSDVASDQANISSLQGAFTILNTSVYFDNDPWTLGFAWGAGGYMPLAERTREHD